LRILNVLLICRRWKIFFCLVYW